jgi:rhodanese-related sulfurtransferase
MKWIKEGRDTSADVPELAKTVYTCIFDGNLVRSHQQILDNLKTGEELIVDARPEARFNCTVPEPRSDVKGGRIPGSLNVPSSSLSNEDGTMKSPEDLRKIFETAGVEIDGKPIVTSCGSGITACVVMLALEIAGAKEVSLYDGSWTEFGVKNVINSKMSLCFYIAKLILLCILCLGSLYALLSSFHNSHAIILYQKEMHELTNHNANHNNQRGMFRRIYISREIRQQFPSIGKEKQHDENSQRLDPIAQTNKNGRVLHDAIFRRRGLVKYRDQERDVCEGEEEIDDGTVELNNNDLTMTYA